MKREIKKKLQSICDEVGTAAAAEKLEELTEQFDENYDARIKAGMNELDAYRDVMRNVDQIKKMLENLPDSQSENSTAKSAKGKKTKQTGTKKSAKDDSYKDNPSYKRLKKYLSMISTCMWICAAVTFLVMGAVGYASSWLIFIQTAIGQIIINMIDKINRGREKQKVYKAALTSIAWLMALILFFSASKILGTSIAAIAVFAGAAVITTIIKAIFDD